MLVLSPKYLFKEKIKKVDGRNSGKKIDGYIILEQYVPFYSITAISGYDNDRLCAVEIRLVLES